VKKRRIKGRWNENKIKIMKKIEEKFVRKGKKTTAMNKIFPDTLRLKLLA
jgi:radical SAM superfamily enzyme